MTPINSLDDELQQYYHMASQKWKILLRTILHVMHDYYRFIYVYM